jgi:hypothetical protein
MSKIRILVLVIAIIIVAIPLILLLSPPIEHWSREKELEKNEVLFLYFIKHFDDLGYDYVFIGDENSFYASSGREIGKQVPIEDEEIKNEIRELLVKQKYLSIEKSEDCVRFVKGGFLDNSYGYAYMFSDGKPKNFRANTFIKLSKEQWYWYSEH